MNWSQYIPYFNDGDVCRFRVGEITFETTEDAENESQEFCSYDEIDILSKTEQNMCDLLDTFLSNNETFLKATMGDHCKNRVTKSGIETSAYHDHN